MCAGVLPVWSLCPVSLLRPPISTLFPYTTLFRSAWVGDLVKMLQELAPAELGQTAQKGQAAKFSVVADERSNRLLIKGDDNFRRSEEHTSELQSRENLVCRLLLEKKKRTTKKTSD